MYLIVMSCIFSFAVTTASLYRVCESANQGLKVEECNFCCLNQSHSKHCQRFHLNSLITCGSYLCETAVLSNHYRSKLEQQSQQVRCERNKEEDPSSLSFVLFAFCAGFVPCVLHWLFGQRGRLGDVVCGQGHVCGQRPIALCGLSLRRRPVSPERVPDAVGDALGHGPDRLAQSAVLQTHVVLQLPGRHVDVADVPEHPPDEAEEDDDGPCVDEQVVDEDPRECPHQYGSNAKYDVAHCEPEGALAAAHSSGPSLRVWLYLDGR